MSEQMQAVGERVLNGAKSCKILEVYDEGEIQFATVAYGEKTQRVQLLKPYGFGHNPPPGSLGILFALAGQESRQVCIADHPNIRVVRETKPGESFAGNYLTKDHIIFKENADIEINSESGSQVLMKADGTIDITAPGSTINVLQADIIVQGKDVVASGKSLVTHVHGGVEPGGGTTGPPA